MMKVNIGPYSEPLPDNSDYYPREVSVEIDDYDIWNIDATLSLIIEPLIKKFKETTCHIISVEHDDLPEELRDFNDCLNNKFEHTDEEEEVLVKRTNWLLDEMIFAANALNTDWEIKHLDAGFCTEEYRLEDERISNGFRLFGKYMRALWD